MSQDHFSRLYAMTDSASDAATCRARDGFLRSFRALPADDLTRQLKPLEASTAKAEALVLQCLRSQQPTAGRKAFNQAMSLSSELSALRTAISELQLAT